MPKPFDRVKNADNRADMFIKTPYWTPEVENHFEQWEKGRKKETFEERLGKHLSSDVAVSFKYLNESVCATLAHQPSRDALTPYLLTGWSDNCSDALSVAEYKLEVMLAGIWQEPQQPKPSRRH